MHCIALYFVAFHVCIWMHDIPWHWRLNCAGCVDWGIWGTFGNDGYITFDYVSLHYIKRLNCASVKRGIQGTFENYIELHCNALHCIALHCTPIWGIRGISENNITLNCIALHCMTLHQIILHYITLTFIALKTALRNPRHVWKRRLADSSQPHMGLGISYVLHCIRLHFTALHFM